MKEIYELVQKIKNLKKTSLSSHPLCFFITGTDTDVGKTYTAVKLLELLNQEGFKTLGLKSVASGGVKNIHGSLENEDALKLQEAANFKIPYSEINPFCFELPIAPHIAAFQENRSLSAEEIVQSTIKVLEKYSVDILIIEGAGGFEVPLNHTETLGDYAVLLNSYLENRFKMNLKIIVVVGMKLGCLNHALLTFQAIKQKGLEISGFIPNSPPHLSPMPFLEENIETLKEFLK
jgi:dethiobiotin synthetase